MNDISDNDIRGKVQNLLEYQDVEFDNNEINKLFKCLGNDIKHIAYKDFYLVLYDIERHLSAVIDFRDTLRRLCFFDTLDNFKSLYDEFDEGILYIIEEK